jgi:hypothetical protein
VRRRARQQRLGQRFGRRLAGADRFRRLGHSKIMKFRHRRTLYGIRRVAAAFQCRRGGRVYRLPSRGGIGINVDQPRKARNNAESAKSASFSPSLSEPS